MAATDQTDKAAEFGYSVAFFYSDPDLKALLATATSQNYSASRFVAALQNTKWFRTKSESFRKYEALRATDPATWRQQFGAIATHIQTISNQMGATYSNAEARALAETSMKMGWTDEQLRTFLSNHLKQSGGNYFGQAGVFQQQVRKLVDDYGVSVSDSWMGNMVRGAVDGRVNIENIEATLQGYAASKYAGVADRIKAGETVRDIAEPYIQSYAKLLEQDDSRVSLNDPLIQRALTAKGQDGKPTVQTLYDFENTLRNDSRWKSTKNAQDQMSSTANEILRKFGLVG